MGEFSFGGEYRIRKQREIDRVFARRCSVADDSIIIYGCENGLDRPRLAISASRKLGRTVFRNRWKRLIREAFRLNKARIPAGIDYVVIPKRGIEPDFHVLCHTFPRLTKQLKRRLARSATQEGPSKNTTSPISLSGTDQGELSQAPQETSQPFETSSTNLEGKCDLVDGVSESRKLGESTAHGSAFSALWQIGRVIWRGFALVDSAMGLVLIVPVYVYRWTISPLLGHCCRFEPSCSQYFIQAVRKYGAILGSLKGVARILRCHPWHPGGYDPP